MLLEVVRANVANPSLELMWGVAGNDARGRGDDERTGDPWRGRRRGASRRIAVWAEWDGDIWRQDMRGQAQLHVLGAAHGFIGNVYALALQASSGSRRGGTELERRTIDVDREARTPSRGASCSGPSQLEWPYPGRPLE